jgi:hypothetical protein
MWVLPLIHFVIFHGFQFIYGVGFALVLWVGLLSLPRQILNRYFQPDGRLTVRLNKASKVSTPLLALTSAAILLGGFIEINKAKLNEHVPFARLTREMQLIADAYPERAILYIDESAQTVLGNQAIFIYDFYLAGVTRAAAIKDAHFILATKETANLNPMIPENSLLNLYPNTQHKGSEAP